MTRETPYDVIVIGGGAAGTIAAGTSAENGYRTLLMEKNSRLCRKVMITGKGRCNVCNHCDVNTVIEHVPSNGRFLYGAVSKFPPQAVMDFFGELGVSLKTERGNRVFPESDKATDIVDALASFVSRSGVKRMTAEAESLLIEDGTVKGVVTAKGETVFGENVILCTGGKSYPGTGSTGDGYRMAQQAGHSIIPIRPSLVPLTAYGTDCPAMQGLSLRNISIEVTDNKIGKPIYSDFGELLFTHFGLSGPVILSASSHMRDIAPGRYSIIVDLKPALTAEQLDLRLQRDLEKYRNRDFINALGDLLPRKMIPAVVKRSGIPADTKCHQITREQRLSLGTLLKRFTVEIKGFRPIEEAIVTSGGVCVKEVSPKTMGSKLVKGLYFAGELLDVDGYTGGFNLQIAFATGRLAGSSVYQ